MVIYSSCSENYDNINIKYMDTTNPTYEVHVGRSCNLGQENRKYGKKSNKNIIGDEVTVKQKKMIKDEVKIWMNEYLKKSIKEEVGELLKDMDKLKEEKKKLGKDIFDLKREVEGTKKEIKYEVAAMEKMLKNYANQILRYQNLDL